MCRARSTLSRVTSLRLRSLATTTIRGFLMGAADIVPGVSGGTIALITGIYDELIASITAAAHTLPRLARGDFSGFITSVKKLNWSFLLPLLGGMLVAIAVLSSLIEGLLIDHPEAMAGLFLGLVLASIVLASDLVSGWSMSTIAAALGVAVIAFWLLGFQKGPLTDPPLWAWIIAGAIAICAMILPGISGSFLLLVMGMYAPVLAAVHDRELGKLLVFVVGIVVGLAVFSNLLNNLLKQFRDLTLAALIGLMIGSIRVLWPWPQGVGLITDDETQAFRGTGLSWPADGEPVGLPIVLAVVAFVAVLGIAHLAAPSKTAPRKQS